MAIPSQYELDAWRATQQFTGRAVSRQMRNAGDQIGQRVTKLGAGVSNQFAKRPRAQSALSRGQGVASRGAQVAGKGARIAADAMPQWGDAAFGSVKSTVGRVSRAGLSSKRVVRIHKKRGHDVDSLADVRRLDLEQIDAVGGRGASWYYPAAAALSGAGAGLVMSGGGLVTVASGGAAAAPSAAAIGGGFAGDAAMVLGLASRSVGHISLLYGYDPDQPAEKLFVMSVVNAGTAVSSGAKTAAMRDISKLTQALVRGQTWSILNETVVARVFNQFAKAFSVRLTKQGLGKVVPAVGVVVGGTFNWATLEGIFDAADVAYRRRFLLDKYPHLAEEEVDESNDGAADSTEEAEETDEAISVIDELSEAGGPDLR